MTDNADAMEADIRVQVGTEYQPIKAVNDVQVQIELTERRALTENQQAILPYCTAGSRMARSRDHALHLLLERVYEAWRQSRHTAYPRRIRGI